MNAARLPHRSRALEQRARRSQAGVESLSEGRGHASSRVLALHLSQSPEQPSVRRSGALYNEANTPNTVQQRKQAD